MSQDDYRAQYKKLRKGWNDSVSIYTQVVDSKVNSNTTILEAGCGFSNLYKDIYPKANKVIGVDISEEYLKSNTVITEKYVADIANMPMIQDNSIDLIVSAWVLEHIEDPQNSFKEFFRVLKNGGEVVFITPNALNYVVILNRFLPKKIRNFLARKLTKDLVVDPMETNYKVNTIGQIKKYAKFSGLKLESYKINGDPTYVAINPFFFFLGRVIERVLDLPVLNRCKVHLIVTLKKV